MTLLDDFLSDTLQPEGFDHRAHVVVAYELLNRHDFGTAWMTYVRHLKALTRRAGVPEKFNASITFAAMSIIAERMSSTSCKNADTFLEQNPDLLSARSFTAGFSPERLGSDLARRIPLMPDLGSIVD